jgi:GNAT superfamily N-acetyltransferase
VSDARDARDRAAPGHDVPGHDVPGHDAPGHEAPGHDARGREAPGHEARDRGPAASEAGAASVPGGFSLRPAALADADAIAALSGQLGYPVQPEVVRARLGLVLPREDQAVLVARDGDRILGWIHGADQLLVESERRCEIMGLVVDATVRRGGVGRALVAAIERWAAARGLALVSVRSAVHRAESHPFYERLGYERVKTQHVYRKRL